MSSVVYTRFELLRLVRNRRFLLFSLIFPFVLYLLIAGPQQHDHDLNGTGLSAPLYFMVSLASWGTMTGMLSSGARIAGERQGGWNRQLRITPLRPVGYLRAKVVTSYVMALLSLVVLYASGTAMGVRLPAGEWVGMTALILVGLIPFAGLGIALGHLITTDSVGPVIGGGASLLAFVSGTWFPLGDGVIHDIAQWLPSYWLVQANRVALGGGGWGLRAWLVVAAWSVAMAALAAWAYRRDTKRL